MLTKWPTSSSSIWIVISALILLAASVWADNTACASSQLEWYTSVVGETPCMTYQKLRQICNNDYRVPVFRTTPPGDNCNDQVSDCCCNMIAFQLSMLCMNCQQDTLGGAQAGHDAAPGTYTKYRGSCGAGTNHTLSAQVQSAVCNENIRIDNFLYGGWADGSWFYVWMKENAERDHAANNNNTFTHCPHRISPSPTPIPRTTSNPPPDSSQKQPISAPATVTTVAGGPLVITTGTGTTTLTIAAPAKASPPLSSQDSSASPSSNSSNPQSPLPAAQTDQEDGSSASTTATFPGSSTAPAADLAQGGTSRLSTTSLAVICSLAGVLAVLLAVCSAVWIRRRRSRENKHQGGDHDHSSTQGAGLLSQTGGVDGSRNRSTSHIAWSDDSSATTWPPYSQDPRSWGSSTQHTGAAQLGLPPSHTDSTSVFSASDTAPPAYYPGEDRPAMPAGSQAAADPVQMSTADLHMPLVSRSTPPVEKGGRPY